jgi:hypothetical protein
MANEFIARKGLIALNNSQITGSLNISGSSFSVDGPSNSHIEVGTYNVGFDTVASDTVLITGSGLIVSGAMADQNHHNMVKIGNVELVDLNTLLSPNEFLIHNVTTLKITSGSDGGDVAGDDNRLFEHNGTNFILYANGAARITATAAGDLTFNSTNCNFASTTTNLVAQIDDTPGATAHLIYSEGTPHPSPSALKSTLLSSAFSALGGAVTASAVSASSLITDTLSGLSDLTVDVEGDITLDANGADVILKDDGTEFGRFKRDSSDFVIKSATNNKDIVFRGVDDSSTITALTLDMSDAGSATFNNHITASGNISSSGDIAGNTITVAGTDFINLHATGYRVNSGAGPLNLFGNITASGDISSSGDLISNTLDTKTNKLAKTSNTDADHQGDVVFFGGTTSMTAGKIYHYNSSGNWELSNATDNTKSTGLLAVALGAASDTNGMLLKGMVTLDHDPGAVGDKLFLRTSNGLALNSAPGSTGNVTRVIGYCLDASNGQIYFNPSNDHIVHA